MAQNDHPFYLLTILQIASVVFPGLCARSCSNSQLKARLRLDRIRGSLSHMSGTSAGVAFHSLCVPVIFSKLY